MPDMSATVSHQVSKLEGQVVQLSNSVEMARAQVAGVSQQQAETRGDLALLRSEFNAFARRQELANNLQVSTTEVGNLRDQLDHQFGNNKVVRKTAVGILQAFDAGMLAEEALYELSSQLMIQTPGYWLAPILVVLEAWADDDVDRCNNAVNQAFQRDPAKTALFMALVLRRQGRHNSAARWLRHYLSAQDPSALGRDFAVILESIAQGAFGPAGLEVMREFLDRWRAQLLGDEAKDSAQVERWRKELAGHVSMIANARYPRLARMSPQWKQMDDVLRHAQAHQSVLTKYTAMMAEQIAPAARLEDQVDDILDRLVKDFDNEELPLQRKITYHEAIIRYKGDDIAAQRDIDVEGIALEDTKDYLTVQSESALNPDGIGVSRSTQRIAVAACHDWLARAHGGFTRDYRAALPQNVEAVFESSHNIGAKTFNLPRWVGSFTEPMERLELSLGTHWDRHAKPFLDSLVFDWGKSLILPICVTLATLLLIACSPVLGILAFCLSAGIWSLVLWNQYRTAEETRNKFATFIGKARMDSLAQLRGAGAELTDWATEFRRADGVEAQVRGMIDYLATAGQASTPHTRRSVDGRSTVPGA
jgi:hypothetical protein